MKLQKEPDKVIFIIPYPANLSRWAEEYGLNSYYAGMHWTLRKKRADIWHMVVRKALEENKIARKIFSCPVEITFFWDDRLDIDNHAIAGKMTVDALKGWLIDDDSRKYIKAVSHRFWNQKCIGVSVETAKERGR